MAFRYKNNVRPLYSLSDDEVNKIVDLYSSYIFSVNNRRITAIETWYFENPDESILYIRITTEPDQPDDGASGKLVYGFQLLFYTEDQGDIYFSPLTDQNFYKEWLDIYGITAPFISHQLGIIKVYEFFRDQLKLWNNQTVYPLPEPDSAQGIPWKKIHRVEETDE